MKKFIMAFMALSVLVACGDKAPVAPSFDTEAVVEKKDIDGLGVEIYLEAAEKLKKAESENELALVEMEIQNAIEALENSEEMNEYVACLSSGDSVALQKYEASRLELEEAAAAYSVALLDAYMRCSK